MGMQIEIAGAAGDPTDGANRIRAFLIADVRGYSRFTTQWGDEAAARLATKFATIIRAGVQSRGGQVIELRGDEALAVFGSIRQALHAALDLQARFRRETEADPSLPLGVGIGLDAGEAVPVEGGYRGAALNLAARLCAIALAGEVLVSESAIHVAGKTEGITYVERGQVDLKGFAEPVNVFLVLPENEAGAHAPTRPADRSAQAPNAPRTHNLPVQLTPFLGRDQQVAAVKELLAHPDVRLLTLTGPGGAGKTRLSLRVAEDLVSQFSDGVWFVPLAAIADTALVVPAIARALAVREAGETPFEELAKYLRNKHMLLVLDNFEQVIEAAQVITHLLEAAPRLRILVTSRTVLSLSAEHDYAVPPLSLPERGPLPPVEQLVNCEAIMLFTRRAQAARADFTLTDENAPAVVEICRRLDGLPLAIELAAARVRFLSPQAILARLGRRLPLLTGGARDLPARHRTLRATIDWSHTLLNRAEQALFARLSVFAGSWSLEAAEAICNPEGELDIFGGLSSLVDQSLVQQERDTTDDPRFVMLETIREYASERLDASGLAAETRTHHMEFYLALAEAADRELRGPLQGLWLERLAQEHDNMRAALTWSLEHDSLTQAASLAAALSRFWQRRGHLCEGSRWIETIVTGGNTLPEAMRAKLLNAAGTLRRQQGDYGRAKPLFEESLGLSRKLGDTRGVASALHNLALVLRQQGEYAAAISPFEESLQLFEELGDKRGIAISLNNLGLVARYGGEDKRALEFFQRALTLVKALGDKRGIGISLTVLGYLYLDQGEDVRAEALLKESLALRQELNEDEGIAYCLEGLAGVAALRGLAKRAARLFGAAETLREASGYLLPPVERERYERYVAIARAHIEPSEFAAAWARGRALTLEEAVQYSLDMNHD